MFGLIVSGRLVQTDFQQISATQFVITVPDADSINHLVIFLTGTIPFPDGFGGSVYFSWPCPNAPPSWQLLGFLTNAKPSNIYKITKLKNDPTGNSSTNQFGFSQPSSHNAQIGISIEPLEQIAAQSPNAITEPSNMSTFVEFAENTIHNFFDYVASFAVSQSHMTPNPSETYVPMSAVRNWYTNFERKLKLNPKFWKS
nr:EOG090X0D82 [Eurycercus lamellatus]